MDPADATLVEAWRLAEEDNTDAVMDRFEELLPTLVAAGYATRDEYLWRFTPAGVARAEELTGETDDPA